MGKQLEVILDPQRELSKQLLKEEIITSFFFLAPNEVDWKIDFLEFNLDTKDVENFDIEIYVENLDARLIVSLYHRGDMIDGSEIVHKSILLMSISNIMSSISNATTYAREHFLTAVGAVAISKIMRTDIIDDELVWTKNHRIPTREFIELKSLEALERNYSDASEIAEVFSTTHLKT